MVNKERTERGVLSGTLARIPPCKASDPVSRQESANLVIPNLAHQKSLVAARKFRGIRARGMARSAGLPGRSPRAGESGETRERAQSCHDRNSVPVPGQPLARPRLSQRVAKHLGPCFFYFQSSVSTRLCPCRCCILEAPPRRSFLDSSRELSPVQQPARHVGCSSGRPVASSHHQGWSGGQGSVPIVAVRMTCL